MMHSKTKMRTSIMLFVMLLLAVGMANAATTRHTNVNVTGNVTNNLIPNANNTWALGSSTFSWSTLFVNNLILTSGLNASSVVNPPANCTVGPVTGWSGNLGSSICTDSWLYNSGDIMTGDLNFTGSGIRNLSLLTAAANLDLGPYTLTGTQFISDIAQGTAPLVVTSTTLVSNLNSSYANSSNFWDNLDSPSDINAADITDDNTYVKVAGDTWTGNMNGGEKNLTNISNLDVTNPTHCHAYKTIPVNITNTTSYLELVFDTTAECMGMSTDGQNFTVEMGGHYRANVDFLISKEGGASTTIESVLLKNGIVINGTARQRTVGTNNRTGFFGINVAIDLSQNDNLSVGLTGSTDLAKVYSACILCPENVTASITITKEN